MLLSFMSQLDGSKRTALTLRMPALNGTTSQVAIPLNDSRTAFTRVSMYDETAMKAMGNAYARLLWVYYKPTHLHTAELVFLGPIFQLDFQYDQGAVQLNAIDSTVFAKKAYHRYGDIVVDRGYTVDGRGMRDLWSSVVPSDVQIARGVKHPGALFGYDSVPRLPRPPAKYYAKNNATYGPPNYAMTAKVERFSNVWESMTNLTQISGEETGVGGPDFDFRPLDRRDKGYVYAAGTGRVERATRPAQVGSNIWYCQLDTYNPSGPNVNGVQLGGKGRSLVRTVRFQYGFGWDNLDDFTVLVDGDQEINYATVTAPGGTSSKSDTLHRALAHSEPAWRDHGIIQNVIASSNPDNQATLLGRAEDTVNAYGYAPTFITLKLKPDNYQLQDEGPRKYAYFDFEHGDRVMVGGKKGFAKFMLENELVNNCVARITQIQLSDDQDGATTQFVEVVPSIAIDSTGDGE